MLYYRLWIVLAGLLGFSTSLLAAEPPQVEKFLIQGQLAAGEKQLSGHLKEHPEDAQIRFELGTLQFLRAVERLGQSLYKFGGSGSKSRLGQQIPFIRLAVPKNPQPEKIRYADVRTILQQLIDDLATAEAFADVVVGIAFEFDGDALRHKGSDALTSAAGELQMHGVVRQSMPVTLG